MAFYLSPTQTDFGQQEHNVRCYHTFSSWVTNSAYDGNPQGLTVTGLTGGWTDGTYGGTSTGGINITYGNRGLLTDQGWQYVTSGTGGPVYSVDTSLEVPLGADPTKMSTDGIYNKLVYWQVHAWTDGWGYGPDHGWVPPTASPGDPAPIIPIWRGKKHIYRTYNKEIFYSLDALLAELLWLINR